ncbi:serine/threonine-protein kinase [Streptomyces mirabilis]|uniref:serine/threonine protein kinase n=1 Tax=Streptomyces mirabilis TaxID=68239 RepID=UPI0036EFBD68
MEHLRQDDPPQIGPYATLARFDSERELDRTSDRRYIARSTDGRRTVTICVPRTDVDPTRWAIEAEGIRQQSLPHFLPVTEVGGSAAHPWYATPYVPRLPLTDALAAYGGPLPEAVIRSLGAILAGALAAAHGQGVVHAGISPAAVLLGAGGPYLACFGAVRAAAPDGEQRIGAPGLDPGCLPPEQAQGGRPRPLGDVYALGAVLSYASTGHTVPQREELPLPLRELITACLSRDAGKRPSVADLTAELAAPVTAPPSASPPAYPTLPASDAAGHTQAAPIAGPIPTVLDGSPLPIPLPARIVAALARQSSHVLAAQLPERLMEMS